MRIGFTCGVFDLFHSGHVLMLKECKENCDHLIVALNKANKLPPEKNKPIFTIEERVLIMESCKFVDKVLTYDGEEELIELMRSLNIHTRFLGEDYKGKTITGTELSKEIYYTNRGHGLSTSGYIKKIAERYKS